MSVSAVAATIIGVTWIQRKIQDPKFSTLSTKSAHNGLFQNGEFSAASVRKADIPVVEICLSSPNK